MAWYVGYCKDCLLGKSQKVVVGWLDRNGWAGILHTHETEPNGEISVFVVEDESQIPRVIPPDKTFDSVCSDITATFGGQF